MPPNPQVIPTAYLNKFMVGSTDLVNSVSNIKLRLPWGGRATLAVNFTQWDEDRTDGAKIVLNPQTLAPDVCRPAGYSTTNAAKLELKCLGEATKLPRFLGGRVDQEKWADWTLGDYNFLLEKNGVKLNDIVPSQNAWAHATIKTIVAGAGLDPDKVVFRFPDFRIRLMRLGVGQPVTWLDMICRIVQAARHWEDDVLILEPCLDLNDTWYFGPKNLESFRWWENDPPAKNTFTVSRQERTPGTVGEQNCTGGQCVGRKVNVRIDPPSRTVNIDSEAFNGVLENYVWFDVDDNPITYGVGAYRGAVPAARMEADYHPNYNNNAGGGLPPTYTPHFSVILLGASQASLDPFTFTESHAGSVARYTAIKDYQSIEDSVVYDATTGQNYAKALAFESARKSFQGTIVTRWLNPKWRRGHKARVDHFESRTTSAVLWNIDDIEKAWTGEDWLCTLSISRAPDAGGN